MVANTISGSSAPTANSSTKRRPKRDVSAPAQPERMLVETAPSRSPAKDNSGASELLDRDGGVQRGRLEEVVARVYVLERQRSPLHLSAGCLQPL